MKIKLLLFLIVFHFVKCCDAQSIYVAVSGNDNASGTVDKPLHSLNAALQKVAGMKTDAVVIYLRKGVYPVTETIMVTPAVLLQHQLTITAYKNEQVTLSGAAVISTRWNHYKGKLLQSFIGRSIKMDQLFCNGRLMKMARYPNYDSTARVFGGTAADAISINKIRQWSDPAGGFVHALHRGEWGDFHYRIDGKIKDSLILSGGWQNNRPAPMHNEYRFVENIFEELDAPGEWFYNTASGMLYFYPPEAVDINKAIFERSVVDNIIEIRGASDLPVKGLTISGITFSGTNRSFMQTKEPLLRSDWAIFRGGAIVVSGAEQVTIEKCNFTKLGGNAVFLSDYNRNVVVAENHIHYIGANAVAIVGNPSAARSPSFRYEEFVPMSAMDMEPGPKTDNYPAKCSVYNNLIHDIGYIEKQVAGVEISMAMDISVIHNTIYNTPRAGINIGDGTWGGHEIAFNDVFNTVLETGDHGAFNSWGRDRYWLPGIDDVNERVEKFPELPLLDALRPVLIHDNRFHCEHGWDIDLDDGSSNYHIYNNVCLNGGLKLREGFFRVVENNIIVNNTFHPHVWYAKSMDVFRLNIVTNEYAPIRVPVWGKIVDSNFFIQSGGLEAARKNGTDWHSQSGDPLFKNQQAGDFSLKPGSPFFSLGFVNFRMDQFGVTAKKLKQQALSPRISAVGILLPAKTGAITDWTGASIKNIETLGEQSASGVPDKNGVLVVAVNAGSLAEKNGLAAGDVIIAINERAVNNVAELLNGIQSQMWMGIAKIRLYHHQVQIEKEIKLK